MWKEILLVKTVVKMIITLKTHKKMKKVMNCLQKHHHLLNKKKLKKKKILIKK